MNKIRLMIWRTNWTGFHNPWREKITKEIGKINKKQNKNKNSA